MPRPRNPARLEALHTSAATFHGAACPAGHTERHTKSRACVECQRDGLRRRRGTVTPRQLRPAMVAAPAEFADLLG